MKSSAIQLGIKHQVQFVVEASHLAHRIGSGMLPVLSTPSLIAWLEFTAMETVASCLSDNETTVGVAVSFQHLKAVPLLAVVVCQAVVTALEGRRISFEWKAFDAAQVLIGSGSHDRFVVDVDRFMAKLS
ncbi:MAG: thioesterase family protein [Microbacter sp.]